MTRVEIELANNDIAKSLSNVYIPSNLLRFDGDINSIKTREGEKIEFIYFPNVMADYYEKSNDFFNFIINKEKCEVEYVKHLFDEHIIFFVFLLKKMLKHNANNSDISQIIYLFTENYWGKYIDKNFIFQEIISKFDDNKTLAKISEFSLYLKNRDDINTTNYDTNIFKSPEAFLIFSDYTEQHVVDEYVDFSYIFQELKEQGLIFSMKHLDFAKWLKENNYINEKIFNKIDEEKGFRSLDKSRSDKRLNAFIKLKEKHIR